MNVIASYRAKAYVDYLKLNGFEPTIVSHNWSGDLEQETTFNSFKTYNEIRIPLKRNVWSKMFLWAEKRGGVIFKIIILFSWLLGFFDTNHLRIESYNSYKKFLSKHLETNQYDVVLGIYSPFFHLRTLSWIYQKFRIPIVADFRDLHDNRVMDAQFKPSLKEKLRNILCEWYLKKWLRKALFISSVSKLWAEKLSKIIGLKGVEVLNGYENDQIEKIIEEPQDKFNITSIGTLYNNQDWKAYYSVINKFLKDKSPKDVVVNFIGIREGYRFNLREEILANIPPSFLNIEGRVDKEIAVKYVVNSQALLFPIPTGVKGYYTGKIFEYLASGTPIFSYPDDGDVVSQLLKKTKRGYVFESLDEFETTLNLQFEKWKKGELLPKPNLSDQVKFYSRSNQVKIFANHLSKELQNN